MKFSGIISAISPLASGVGKSGKPWRKIEACLTYDNFKPEWPKAIVFSVMNDNIEKFGLQVGGEYSVEVDFYAREYNGRRFMSASCWHVEPINDNRAQQVQPQQQAPAQQGWQAAYPQQQQFTQQPQPALVQNDDALPF